ncbi:MAG: hypothetical protein ACRD2C_03115 [Acidimicrobiales bacterium]
MASWRDFRAFVKSTYDVAQEQPGMIQLLFDLEDGRSQAVFLWRRQLMKGSEEWLVIESPFAEVGRVDLDKALHEAGDLVCGGVVIVGKLVIYRHAVPLANLDTNEFRRPLQLVTLAADRLESRLAGGDSY